MKVFFNLVKFSHTIFALPFAMAGFTLGHFLGNEIFSWVKLVLVLFCMVTARNTAMAFNRYIDRNIDAANERTSIREIPSGLISLRGVIAFIIANALLFIISAYFINKLCFFLSPVALAVIMGYSLTKRFTFLCHLILGVGLSLAPIGAFIAVTGQFHWIPVLLSAAVLFWVSGFDIIYALQDEQFDKEKGLFSIPSYFGSKTALMISRGLHFLSATLITLFIYFCWLSVPEIGYLSIAGVILFMSLLVVQQNLVTPTDLSRVNMAFFTNNGIASLVFGICFIADLLI